MNGYSLLERTEYTLLHGTLDTELHDICTDNRTCAPFAAFVCIEGARFDTHTCVEQIAQKKAALIVVSAAWAAVHGEEIRRLPEQTAVVSVSDTRLEAPAIQNPARARVKADTKMELNTLPRVFFMASFLFAVSRLT